MNQQINTIREALDIGHLAAYDNDNGLDADTIKQALAALAELEAAMREQSALTVRACCEAEKADPDHPDTICISVQDLTGIVECYAAPPAQQAQRPDFHDMWTGYLKDGETPFERFLRERKDLDALMKLYQRTLEENAQLKAQAEALPQEYTGPRCMCVLTGCRSGPGCPHYTNHCKAHIAHQQAEPPWVQCTTRNNDCLGGCRSRAEHERYNKGAAAPQQKGGA